MDFLFNTNKHKIGIAKIGGIGDSIQLLFLSHAIRRKYPESEITLYIRDKNEYIKRDSKIDRVIFTGYCDWNKLVRKEVNKYDLFFDDRYYVGVWNKYRKKMVLHTKDVDKYWNFFNHLNELNCNLLEMSAKNSGVKLIEEDFNLDFLIENNKLELISSKYILLHNDDSEVRKTKAYQIHHWNKVIQYLKVSYPDLNIIQVGNLNSTKLDNIIDLRGKTNFEELCSLVRGAELIITPEGLLPHLSRAFKTKTIVLFGPTPINCFGYKEHINIQGESACSSCWYSTDDWFKACPLGHSNCISLNTILPQKINNLIPSII
jgi:ADP-heptose:LPS heptosyltransferase